MGLGDIGRIIRRRWLVVVATTLVCAAAAAAYASTIPTTYTASTRLYVSMATGTSVNDAYQGGLAAQQRITSYSHIAGGLTVAERVVDDLGLDTTPAELQSRISVTFPPASALLDVSVRDSTAEGARVLADRVAAQFRRLVDEIETTVAGAAPATRATVIDPAQAPTAPTGPDLASLLAIGVVVGLGLGGLGALVFDRFDRIVRRPEQLAGVLPVLASVPDGEPGAARAVARLCAQLAAGRGGPVPATVMLTSFSRHSAPATALQLSAALADTGRRVALVDADVTGEGVSARLGRLDEPGLADWLRAPHAPVGPLVRVPEDGAVAVLAVGDVDARTSALLCSDRIADLLSALRDRFDHVVVDTAPLPADPAALTVSRRCDATLALVELGTSSVPEVRAATATFAEAGSGLLGAVTAMPPSRRERRRQQRRGSTSTVPTGNLLPST